MFILSTPLKQQSGVVLVISLVMLLLLTLIGVTSVQTTSLEEKMAGNMRDQNMAFQSAEAGLRAGEQRIEQIWNNGAGSIQTFCNGTSGVFYKAATANVCDGACTAPSCPAPSAGDSSTWTTASKSVVAVTGNTQVASEPRYYITYISNIPDIAGVAPPELSFMITARGTGGQNNTQVILRSYYGGKTKFQP
ncbi:pilus assembly PilX family protein [methanotrophic endosymbiont of Bathymodiolus puteoserpentis (Logatchev)]|jgi:type IV pilus assembly protein PilX|uniref:pilus assembly PilX family protein n=1 Tax=methanotrophic endosymbiont of Bathymodiolus puteoserpentis (Logatchev) TaxID=343235 RepID=UPI0013CCC615|nr:PilX N-terminal domain-containing pilus assembly protein [methanotrophic endosymbiont of Bathymodiolus puteoserpentis (Logatchev)]SHE20922.1 Type IV fimbrial biogenesis protein PilX [methanotrophic endosymbiont of Bathymodiolus puteoserpentis (Logatchev)]